MNNAQREDVKALIEFYESKRWDWSSALEFLVREYNNSPDTVILRSYWNVPQGYKQRGRPRSKHE